MKKIELLEESIRQNRIARIAWIESTDLSQGSLSAAWTAAGWLVCHSLEAAKASHVRDDYVDVGQPDGPMYCGSIRTVFFDGPDVWCFGGNGLQMRKGRPKNTYS